MHQRYDETRKAIQHHRELSRSGSEAMQGCSSASIELEPTVQGCIWRHESDGWYIFEYR